jgi:hypothetical protein
LRDELADQVVKTPELLLTGRWAAVPFSSVFADSNSARAVVTADRSTATSAFAVAIRALARRIATSDLAPRGPSPAAGRRPGTRSRRRDGRRIVFA